MKRVLSVILVLVTLCCTIGIHSLAEEHTYTPITSGKCGDNLTWNVDLETKTLTISGSGEMYDYRYYYDYMMDESWQEQNSIGDLPPWVGPNWMFIFDKIIICEGVTSIGDGAFRGAQISALTLPKSLRRIGIQAFIDVRGVRDNGLLEIIIPKGVSEIGDGAFSQTWGLMHIAVAEGNTHFTVKDGVLFSADMSRLVKYPDQINRRAYSIPDSVKFLDYGAFAFNFSLETINLSTELLEIGEGCFAGCESLHKINWNKKLISIGADAFWDCTNLESTNLPNSLRNIGNSAFWGTGIIEITIPEGLIEWEPRGFNWRALLKITLPTTLLKARGFSSGSILEAWFMGLPPEASNFRPEDTKFDDFTLYYPSLYGSYWCPDGSEIWAPNGMDNYWDQCQALPFDSLRGDANCDERVTAADAAVILRALGKLSHLTPLGALQADTTGKGYYDTEDAKNVLRYIVRLDSPAGVMS
ncbi:MAG: leucine-rich repeat protein [Clostridiales bacterium]|nr:leucine-rich repeat protein [Clostridiales bacterium]